ncbi:MAG: hypothetical protein JNL58_28345 [Planctomyces sp.]|nr:hypothetical protein [Planctomyces sp.]
MDSQKSRRYDRQPCTNPAVHPEERQCFCLEFWVASQPCGSQRKLTVGQIADMLTANWMVLT